ncbi:cell wall-binding repeat-containing protein [Herbiconiux sp. P16]|uniref:cell wall-binding repeat-containing protein n=1 Tax=Herbiconiux wuyangfengii TaxID=3342794 RepID=UPI0035B7F671
MTARHGRKDRRLIAAVITVAAMILGTGAAATAIGIAHNIDVQSGAPSDVQASAPASLELNAEFVPLVSTQGLPTPERVSGADRYAGAVAISQRAFPNGAPVVYIATGENFTDALTASPAAIHQGGPLLLTSSGSLIPAVQAEITRLAPGKIVVVGGTNSITPTVYTALQSLAPSITRLGGADRFEASRNVTSYAFSSGSSKAYIVTGVDFPDALGTGSAAGLKDAPVILVNGGNTTIDPATLALLQSLGTQQVFLAGGPNSLSTGIETTLDAAVSTFRLSGDDRYRGSQVINREAFVDNSSYVLLASGANYPDALAGSSWAGAIDAPLYLVPTNCVPDGVLSDIRSRAATHIVLLGGTASLDGGVQSLTSCGW